MSITRNTSASDRAEFGIPLFVTETVPAGFTERARSYTDLEGMTDDGFLVTDNAYLAAQRFFAQNPSVSKFIVGHKEVGDADWVAAITAISEENDEWYVVTTETRVKADVLAIAAYVEANIKLYFVGLAEAGSYGAFSAGSNTDIAGSLTDLNYDRTITYYHHDAATEFVECALAGHNLPFLAGQATWAFLQLKGVSQALQTAGGNPLTATHKNNLELRNCNYSVTLAGKTVTQEGKVVGGEWIDVIRGVDALDEEMTKSLFDLLINQQGGKVPYDNSGLNMIRSVMISVLDDFVDRGFIQPNFVIDIPESEDISFADKSNRIVKDISFEAYLVGAIHGMDPIQGNVTFEAA